MRKMRFLTVLAAILLSCGIANAQTGTGDDNVDEQEQYEPITGDVNGDGKLDVLDVSAAAESIMDGKTSGPADVNKDQKVNAADVVTVVDLIQNTNYCYLGREVPTKDNYTLIDGVYTIFESIDQVLAGYSQQVTLMADEAGFFYCPSSWNVKDLVLQDQETGNFFDLNAIENDIADYDVFLSDKVTADATYRLKRKADAEAYIISITKYFYLGAEEPTSENYYTLEGVTSEYETLEEVLKAAKEVSVEIDKTVYVLCPEAWDVTGVVAQDQISGAFYGLELNTASIENHKVYKTKEKTADASTIVLKTQSEAEKYYAEKNPTVDDGKNWFWMGTYFPKSNTFPTINGEEVPGIIKSYTSLDEAIANSARAYSASDYAVVLYPSSWGTKNGLVFVDESNKKYYAVKKKDVTDFPDYTYYETAKKIGVNTTIKLSTESAAKAAGFTLYEEAAPQTPVNPVDPVDPVNPPIPVGNEITFVIQNNCGKEVRLSGRVTLNIGANPNDWGSSIQVSSDIHGPQVGASWAYNDIIIPAGGSYSWKPSISTAYTNGNYYFMTRDKDQYNYSIYLYSRIWRTSKGKTEGSTGMYRVYPLQNTKLQRGMTYTLNLYWANPEASLDPDRSGKYIILGYGKQSL
jgi:hypothetical protein